LAPDAPVVHSELASREFLDGNPVNPLGDHDLGVFAVADIAPENASTALPVHSVAASAFLR
jgi:hypothetical protein